MNAVLMQSWNSFLGTESTLFINDAMGFNRNTSTKDKQISPPRMTLDFLLGVFHLRNLPKIDMTHQDLEGDRWMFFFFRWSFGHSWRLFIHWRVAKDSETGRRAVETVLAPKCVSWDVFCCTKKLYSRSWCLVFSRSLGCAFCCLTQKWQRGRKMPLSKLQSSNWRCIRCKIWLSFWALPAKSKWPTVSVRLEKRGGNSLICVRVFFHLAEIQPVEEILHQLTLRISHFNKLSCIAISVCMMFSIRVAILPQHVFFNFPDVFLPFKKRDQGLNSLCWG